MLKLEEWMDVRSLHKEGHSIKAIARLTGRSRNTDLTRDRRKPSVNWCRARPSWKPEIYAAQNIVSLQIF